jgi:hypothetical protein
MGDHGAQWVPGQGRRDVGHDSADQGRPQVRVAVFRVAEVVAGRHQQRQQRCQPREPGLALGTVTVAVHEGWGSSGDPDFLSLNDLQGLAGDLVLLVGGYDEDGDVGAVRGNHGGAGDVALVAGEVELDAQA